MKVKSKHYHIALLAGIAAWSGLAQAQETPELAYLWETTSNAVGFHESVSACIYPTIGAANTWNAVGAGYYFWTDSVANQPRVATQTQAYNYSHHTVEDKEIPDLNVPMQTAQTRTGQTLTTMINSDTYVDRARMSPLNPQRVGFTCTAGSTVPADKLDWQTAMLHELGHAAGFIDDHNITSRRCAMYYAKLAGENQRVLCDAEKQNYLKGYGLQFKILSIPNVTGPHNTNILAKINFKERRPFPYNDTLRILRVLPAGPATTTTAPTQARLSRR